MYPTKRWIAVTARANDSCLMIVKDDLLKVAIVSQQAIPMVHAASVVTYGQLAQARVKHCGNRGLHTADKRNRRSLVITIADVPPQQGDSSWGRGFFAQIVKNFVKKTRT